MEDLGNDSIGVFSILQHGITPYNLHVSPCDSTHGKDSIHLENKLIRFMAIDNRAIRKFIVSIYCLI